MKKRIVAAALSIATVLSSSTILLDAIGSHAEVKEEDIIGVESVPYVCVTPGTTLEQVEDLLPEKVILKVAKADSAQGTVLHTAKFEESDWTLFDKNAISFTDGKLVIGKSSAKVKAVTGGEYDDFVLETTIKGTADAPSNNFGVMLRATDVSESGSDSYNGYYVGIGKNNSKMALVIGYANGKWQMIDDLAIDYQPNKDYKLKVLMVGDTMAVWLDGELLYVNNNMNLYSKGSVGVRTYHQLFECSSFEVRTPSDKELTAAGLADYDTTEVTVEGWKTEEYKPDTYGNYVFVGTVKGTNYQVKCNVTVMTSLEAVEGIQSLSYENVDVTEGFYREYIKLMICKVVPTAISNVEKGTGGMPNIINAAKKHRGEDYAPSSGAYYVDSDVHKVLESMCFALAIDPMGDAEIIAAQKKIDQKLQEWIPYYQDAQEESGYFDTWYILDDNKVRYSDVEKHELYCMGHFMEAAIAHYQCTDGKDTRLLDMAVKCADYLYGVFGWEEGKRRQIAGHQEIELALLKLAKTVVKMDESYSAKAHKYAELATFFLEIRGQYDDRTVEGYLARDYWQDHAPVSEQYEAVGHSVRAQYMYTAMADLAAVDEEYREKYDYALQRLWSDVTYTKQYVTGGVGQTAHGEGFLESYNLPNDSAYCETCAGISNMMWNRSMSTIYAGSAFADHIETDIYNAVLGCVNLDGNEFYYVNSLDSSAVRNAWFGTACCPPNLTRTVLSIGGYIYNYSADALYFNQYIANNATVPFGSKNVSVNMTSEMPWKGNGSITLDLEGTMTFKLCLRMPAWSDGVTLKINGVTEKLAAGEDGYITIEREWKKGDKVEFDFSMPVIFEETVEEVKENVGYTSVRRGPLVYCLEEIDHDFNVRHTYLDKTSEAELVWTESIDGKTDGYGVRDMYLIKLGGFRQGVTEDKPVELTFIPFYARMNRGKTQMCVYVAKQPMEKALSAYATPSASYVSPYDQINYLNDGTDSKDRRWTSYKEGEVVKQPWVQYDFDDEVVLSGCKIWWYNDNGGVKLADGFEILYKNNETDTFTPVSHEDDYECDNDEGFITYEFEDVAVTSLRIVIETSRASAGIVEWDLIAGSLDAPVDPPVDPSEDPSEEPSEDPSNEPSVEPSEESAPVASSKDDPASEKTSKDENGGEKNEKGSIVPYIVGGAIALAAAAAVVAFIVAKKKKK
ncbi:MAG: glycoside hydrolase family 127 protein [Clostridia bacterium]|nr:glycoside hydrolase family 127 protein [Clostridia bacterium]